MLMATLLTLVMSVGLFAFGLSLGFTLRCERIARRVGLVALPREDRWHGRPVPLLGGAAIACGTLVPLALIAGKVYLLASRPGTVAPADH